MNKEKRNIVLVGFMGSGKTTVGRRVATRLGMDFYDTDDFIRRCEGMPAGEVLHKKGEKYFEGAQRFAVQNLCENRGSLISTGGGTVLDEYNGRLLRENAVWIWLCASAKTVFQNTHRSRSRRPEISEKTVEELEEILARYEPYYAVSDIKIEVDGRDMDEVTEEVLAALDALDTETDTHSAVPQPVQGGLAQTKPDLDSDG